MPVSQVQFQRALSQSTSKLEHLQAIVSRIDRYNAIAFVHSNPPRIRQLSRLMSARTPDSQTLARLLVDHLNAVVAELAHDQVSMPVDVQALGKSELSQTR